MAADHGVHRHLRRRRGRQLRARSARSARQVPGWHPPRHSRFRGRLCEGTPAHVTYAIRKVTGRSRQRGSVSAVEIGKRKGANQGIREVCLTSKNTKEIMTWTHRNGAWPQESFASRYIAVFHEKRLLYSARVTKLLTHETTD